MRECLMYPRVYTPDRLSMRSHLFDISVNKTMIVKTINTIAELKSAIVYEFLF